MSRPQIPTRRHANILSNSLNSNLIQHLSDPLDIGTSLNIRNKLIYKQENILNTMNGRTSFYIFSNL